MVGVSDRIDGWWNQTRVSIEGFKQSTSDLVLSKSNNKTNGNPFLIREKRRRKNNIARAHGRGVARRVQNQILTEPSWL